MSRPLAVNRMRGWVGNYMIDRVRILRDTSDPDTWTVDAGTGDLTRPDPEIIYEGPATIAAQEQRYSEADVDRINVRIPANDAELMRNDIVEIIQSPQDRSMITGRWVVLDVDMGSHHVTRRIEAASRIAKAEFAPREWVGDR